jgi:hypothetical protein
MGIRYRKFLQSSLLVFLEWHYRLVAGLSPPVVKFMLGSWKASMAGAYECYWKRFKKYLVDECNSPKFVKKEHVLEFAAHLSISRGLRTSTIRSAISGLRTGLDRGFPELRFKSASMNRMTTMVLKGIAVNDVKEVPHVDWNVSALLRVLSRWKRMDFSTCKAFERASSKLIILMMLAGGLRISEMAHLRRDAFSFRSNPCSMTWGFVHGFQRKTETGLKRFTPFRIQGLPDGNHNCVVCWTKKFIRKSANLTDIPTLLFNRVNRAEMSLVRASALIKQVVSAACPRAENPKSQHLRKLAASIASNHKVLSIETIMKRGMWAHESTVNLNYLSLARSAVPVVVMGARWIPPDS